ncbi:MAG TPA: SpoIIE family protein phosphatase [Catenuloplanes sp.]|jgi:serine phosphatase RsbU (regulator of sigma subunit)
MAEVEPRRAYGEALERMRTAVRRPFAESRRSRLDQAIGLLAGRVGCRLNEAHAQLTRLAAEQGRDVVDVAASVIQLLEGTTSPLSGQVSATDPGLRWSVPPTGVGDAVPPTVAHRGPPAGGWAEVVQPVLDAMPGDLALLAPLHQGPRVVDYLIEAASPEASDLAGRRGAQLIGLRISDAYATAVGGELWQAYGRVLATGEPQAVGPLTYTDEAADGGEPARYSARVHRLGDRLLVSWTAHEDGVRHADRLAQTERLGNLGWGEWDLLTGRTVWSDQLYRIFERHPDDGPLSNEETTALGMPEDMPLRASSAEAFVRGESVDAVYRYRINGRIKHLRSVVDAVRNAAGEPLKIYGIVQDVTAREVALKRLADVEAQLAEQRRSLAAEHQLAARLQQIILPIPQAPIDLPGLRVALRYLPAEQLSHVGGDWYHAAALPDGTVLLAVGDVAGHGIPAATSMAQLRHALRALTVTTVDPAELLSYLNRLMCDLAEETLAVTATAVVARYDPAARSLTWAQAGHPAPLISRAGSTEPLARPYGPMLGVLGAAAYRTATVTFEPGDLLLLYTDGLVEHRSHTLDEGLAAVIRTVDEAYADNPAQPLSALLSRLRRANPEDDTCVLAARPVTADVAAGASSGPGVASAAVGRKPV